MKLIKPIIDKIPKEYPSVEELQNKLPDDFEINRQNGENPNYICKMIRNDSVEEFIKYINKNNYSLNSSIANSMYETNHFLIKNQSFNLIEYAIFYGSIQIFQYLKLNGVNLKSSFVHYVIHSNNLELIHILEENGSINDILLTSIKCHENDIANYFMDNYNVKIENNEYLFRSAIQHYNFAFIQDNFINQKYLEYFYLYDYYEFAGMIL